MKSIFAHDKMRLMNEVVLKWARMASQYNFPKHLNKMKPFCFITSALVQHQLH